MSVAAANRQDEGWVTDARGQRVRQLDPYALWLARRHHIIPAEPLAEIAREIGFGLVPGQRVLFIISLICTGIIALAIVERGVALFWWRSISWDEALRPIGQLSLMWTPLIFWIAARNVRLKRTLAALLRHRRCPHCGYDLRGLPVEPANAATLCPECGCAWRLPRSESTATD